MSPPLHPLPGNPAAVHLLARALAGTGGRLLAMAETLVRLRDDAAWQGCAGDAFGARVGEVPVVLRAVAERFVGAVAALDELAEAMGAAQAVIGPAVRDDDTAAGAYVLLEDRAAALVAAGATEDDPALLVVRHLQREQVGAQQRARDRHAAALERFRAVDARVARVVRALAEDALRDPGPYRLLARLSTGGAHVAELAPVALAAPELAPVAVAGDWVGTGADALLLLAYGEGDARALATRAALASTGGVGRVLKRGATAGAELTAAGVRTSGGLTSGQRVAAGVTASVRARREAVRTALAGVPERGTPSALLGGPPVPRLVHPPGASVRDRAAASARDAAHRARASAEDAVRRKVLDDWRLASANGPGARRMYVAGMTLEGASRAVTPSVAGDPPAERDRDPR
ncbi:hypothetical protein ACK8HX_02540 [Oryzobacter sp. R7]|uniref:hypothetical protein n=1 Tax=Oryzobacter faecalis TaxID=3388656 RepID=UPI00398C8EA0